MEVSIAAHFIILFTKKLLQVTVMVGGKNSYWQNQPAPRELLGFYRGGTHAALPWISPGQRWEVALATTASATHLASRGNQQQRRQRRARCSLAGGGNTSMLRTAPAGSSTGARRAHTCFSLIQNPAVSKRLTLCTHPKTAAEITAMLQASASSLSWPV